MSVDLGGHGDLEGAGIVERILHHDDQTSEKWNLKAHGPSWEAVKIARMAQRMGRGTSIAVLDG